MTAIGTTKDEVHDRTGWRIIESTAAIPQPVGASRRRRILALPWGNVGQYLSMCVCVCACACMRVTYAIMAGITTCNND